MIAEIKESTMSENYERGKHITDDQILEWIIDGTLVITELDSADPILIFRGRTLKPYLNEQGGRNRMFGTSRWRWKLRNGSKVIDGKVVSVQRNIVRAKLIWMFVNQSVVPDQHRVHHCDENRFNDAHWNLEALHDDAHSALHYGPQDDDF